MARYLVIVCVILFVRLSTGQDRVCTLPYCQCTPAAHPSWTIVNCTVPSNEKLDIMDGYLPESTTDLVIKGAEAVMFGANALSRLHDARRIRVEGAKLILLRKFSAVNLKVINLFLDIEGCDMLRIEEKAFTNIQGPLSVTIKNCDYVSIDGEAFSWILTMTVKDVGTLQLSSGAFMLDPTAANIGKHGPGMTIELSNLTVPEFRSQTFGSSAASISLDNVVIKAIRSEAFTANTYNMFQAKSSTFELIEGNAFAQKSLINNLLFYNCTISRLASGAMQSAVSNLKLANTSIDNVEKGSINITVATISISNCEFDKLARKSFDFSSWNVFKMERNKFNDLPGYAIVGKGANVHEFIFSENEAEIIHETSLAFIGTAYKEFPEVTVYKNNYFGQACHCKIKPWLKKVFMIDRLDPFINESFCTVEEFFARCFNVPEQNMCVNNFIQNVCGDDDKIRCEPFKAKVDGVSTEIKNPRFPHKGKDRDGLSDRDKKIIGIVIVTALGCTIIVMFISLVRCMKRRGHCAKFKMFISTSNAKCATVCNQLCSCGVEGTDNARSISQMSVHEYSERHCLNEPRIHDIIQETILPEMYTEEVVPVDDKATQTLPEELTKELLESLKEKLDDPENYAEAREMIEHLYELIKVEESCNTNSVTRRLEENIYDLPFQNTVPRLGRNRKKMISIGTRVPSLDKLMPLSPYNRQTALAHEYFEPKDFAVHLYAEIANHDKEKKIQMSIPDVVAEQVVPRGPYLRAVHDKLNSSPISRPGNNFKIRNQSSTLKSNKSTGSNTSGRMTNRPLPEKPSTFDPGEGTSVG